MRLYDITDWLSVIPLGFIMEAAAHGLIQWIRKRSIRKVDRALLLLGAFYIVVLSVYIFFEIFPVNYRPILIDGVIEASYPSSTTMLVMCVMPTVAMRIKNGSCRKIICTAIYSFVAFMVGARLASGAHWFTDIIGGILVSSGLVGIYGASLNKLNR